MNFMLQRWHRDPTAVRPRWSLFNTRRSCFSVAYTQVSSANRARCTPGAAGAPFMYKLYSTGARTEPYGTHAATFLGEENSPSTETFNFLLIKWTQSALCNLWKIVTPIAYIEGRDAMLCQRLFRCPRIQQASTYCY
jgi:hypothetical protein